MSQPIQRGYLSHRQCLSQACTSVLSCQSLRCSLTQYVALGAADKKMSRLTTNSTKWLCTQWRLGSAWASTVCSVEKGPMFLHAGSEDWSDWVNAQADLSLHWANMPFCCFFHKVTHTKKTSCSIWLLHISIWRITGCTTHFIMTWLNYCLCWILHHGNSSLSILINKRKK